jgi:acyl-coenzyme A thioesterase 13
MGSLAVATHGQWMTGVSTDIGTSFLKPGGRAGDIIHVRGTVVNMGKTLAYTRVDFRNAAGDLFAFGRMSETLHAMQHHPFMIPCLTSRSYQVRCKDGQP